MEEMKTIYQVEGKLCKDLSVRFPTPSAWIRLTKNWILNFFGPQHFRPEDVTPELKQRLLDYCKKNMVWKKAHRRNGKMPCITV